MTRGHIQRIRVQIWLLGLVSLLVAACGTAHTKPGSELTVRADITPTLATTTPLTPTPVLTVVAATATFLVPPTDLCREYLGLSVLHGETERAAVATSYRCHSATVDSTGQSPARSPDLVIYRGAPITLQLAVEQQPTAIDVRLYPGTGLSASFLRWPEELPMQVEAADRFQPEPAARFQYLAQSVPGPYSLVVRVSWEEAVEVYYAISFMLEDAIK